jgi:23S rRNA (pseudouridine1915-N3)-methyltransferase
LKEIPAWLRQAQESSYFRLKHSSVFHRNKGSISKICLAILHNSFAEVSFVAFKVSLLAVRAGAAEKAFEAISQDYLKRCGKTFSATGRTFRAESQLLAAVGEERRAGATVFYMADLGGVSLDSLQFAERFRSARDGGIRHLILAIGPASGWSDEARSSADLRLSLGAMTLPHELAWLVLAEQIYRASTILQGHPYHLGH